MKHPQKRTIKPGRAKTASGIMQKKGNVSLKGRDHFTWTDIVAYKSADDFCLATSFWENKQLGATQRMKQWRGKFIQWNRTKYSNLYLYWTLYWTYNLEVHAVPSFRFNGGRDIKTVRSHEHIQLLPSLSPVWSCVKLFTFTENCFSVGKAYICVLCTSFGECRWSLSLRRENRKVMACDGICKLVNNVGWSCSLWTSQCSSPNPPENDHISFQFKYLPIFEILS